MMEFSVKDEDDAMRNPQVGDHWHEMLAWHVFVAMVNARMVWTVEGNCDFNNSCEVYQRSRGQFDAYMRYKSPGMRHRSWLTLRERGRDVAGWLDRCQELRRPWNEESPAL